MRIGLIADTHMPGSIDSLWPHALELFAGVDVILHAGDLHTLAIVDELERRAPTWVARGNGDAGIVDDRLRDTWHFDFGGVAVGMIHQLPSPARKSPDTVLRYIDRHFAVRPQVIVYGHTHLEGIHVIDDVLCVNPGSPTLPQNQSLRPGTIGLLDIDDHHVEASIIQLTDDGVLDHGEIRPLRHPRVLSR